MSMPGFELLARTAPQRVALVTAETTIYVLTATGRHMVWTKDEPGTESIRTRARLSAADVMPVLGLGG
jgi:hypothetical protein